MDIIVIGDYGCGKTTLINRIITGNFIEKYQPTVGFTVCQDRTINWIEGAGDNRFRNIADEQRFYESARLCLIVHDNDYIPNKSWESEFRKIAPKTTIIHVVNHFGEFIPQSDEIHHIYHVSVKTGKGIYELVSNVKHLTETVGVPDA